MRENSSNTALFWPIFHDIRRRTTHHPHAPRPISPPSPPSDYRGYSLTPSSSRDAYLPDKEHPTLRANRHFLRSHIWHHTRRCHRRAFMLKLARTPRVGVFACLRLNVPASSHLTQKISDVSPELRPLRPKSASVGSGQGHAPTQAVVAADSAAAVTGGRCLLTCRAVWGRRIRGPRLSPLFLLEHRAELIGCSTRRAGPYLARQRLPDADTSPPE